MKITFQNQNPTADVNASPANRITQPDNRRAENRKSASDPVQVSFSVNENPNFVPGGVLDTNEKGKGKTLTQLQQEAAYTDVGVSQDYMTVMSNTMSAEDYQKMSEEGFHFQSLDPEKAVSIVDKIKAELAKSGKQIIGYTDDIDAETLAAALGSETLARAVSSAFAAADIPLTDENITAVKKAWDMASSLQEPSDGSCEYMIDNGLEPEIWNLYLAQNSGGCAGAAPGGNADLSFLEEESFQKQMEQFLENSGYEVNEENKDIAKWLVERNLALDKESFERYLALQDIEIPVSEEAFSRAAAIAVSEGKDPVYADIASPDAKSLYEKAAEVLSFYETYEITASGEELHLRKQLEEIRLSMTAEVNVRLLKSGFAIDTAPMEQLIDALKQAEAEVAKQYFPEDDDAVSKYEDWNQTNRIMEELPSLPAQVLGSLTEPSLPVLHEQGAAIKADYVKAGESYEALMTAPRSDLGDSIRKAFGNVEELAGELGLEPTEETLRAVRILGYNRMEITAESVARIRETDEQVQSLIRKMTPAATLQMIRDGVNPLETSFKDLNEYFDRLPAKYREEAESYSRFLYGLEKNHQITEQERESFIGVYRLLRQIEKNDGAAVGNIVNTQAVLEFSNLLSSVRSSKFGHFDVKADDQTGFLKELINSSESESISEQISKGYAKEQMEQFRHVAEIETGTAQVLEKAQMPATCENLLAANELVFGKESPHKTLKKKASDLWEKLDDKEAFREGYEQEVLDLKEEAETKTFEEAGSYLDVRAMQLAHRQLSVMGSLMSKEEYFVAMDIGDTEGLVHLTVESGRTEKGSVSIAVSYGESSRIEARLQVKNGKLSGFFAGKSSEEVRKLKEAVDIFNDLVTNNPSIDLEVTDLPVVSSENINMTRMSEINSQEETSSPDNGTLYHVAKLFLQAIRS